MSEPKQVLTEEERAQAGANAADDADKAVPDGRGFDMNEWSTAFEQALMTRIEAAVLAKRDAEWREAADKECKCDWPTSIDLNCAACHTVARMEGK